LPDIVDSSCGGRVGACAFAVGVVVMVVNVLMGCGGIWNFDELVETDADDVTEVLGYDDLVNVVVVVVVRVEFWVVVVVLLDDDDEEVAAVEVVDVRVEVLVDVLVEDIFLVIVDEKVMVVEVVDVRVDVELEVDVVVVETISGQFATLTTLIILSAVAIAKLPPEKAIALMVELADTRFLISPLVTLYARMSWLLHAT
jgi:hypothetical protein